MNDAAGGRGRGRGHDSMVGKCIKIRLGPFKGYRGRVTEVTGELVRVELDSQMKIVTGRHFFNAKFSLIFVELTAVFFSICS